MLEHPRFPVFVGTACAGNTAYTCDTYPHTHRKSTSLDLSCRLCFIVTCPLCSGAQTSTPQYHANTVPKDIIGSQIAQKFHIPGQVSTGSETPTATAMSQSRCSAINQQLMQASGQSLKPQSGYPFACNSTILSTILLTVLQTPVICSSH